MKARALRYVFLYTALLVVLAGFRYATRDTYNTKFDLEERQKSLVLRKSQLEQERIRLESTTRVREWAIGQGMVPQTKVPHEFIQLKALDESGANIVLKTKSNLQVVTKWR